MLPVIPECCSQLNAVYNPGTILVNNAPIKLKLLLTPPPPPFPGKPRAFDQLLCPGSGEFDLCLRGVGKIEPGVSGSNDFFSGAEVANSYKTRVWTRWKSLKEDM